MSSNGDKSRTLAARTMIGVVWLMATRLCLRSLGLISTMVLARLLVPEDFGLVALATAFLVMLNGASNLGFKAALIKFQSYERDDLDTAWTLNILRGCILTLIVLVASRYLPISLDEPRLQPILQVVALLPILQSMRNTKLVQFEMELDYSREAYLNVITKILATFTTISVAILYQSYWALVIGMLVSKFAELVISFILLPYMPRFSLKSTRKLFDFSIWLSLTNFLNATSASFDKFISIALFEARLTGIYYMGQEISALLTREIFRPLNRALYPGLVKFSHDIEKLRANALESVSVIAGVGLPVGVGFAFTASEFVPIVLGPKWLEIIPMVQILGPVLGLQTLTNATHATLLSLGRTQTLFVRSLCSFAVRLPLLLLGGYLFGFVGLFVAHALSEFVYFLMNYLVLAKAIDCKMSELFLIARRSFVSVAVMSIVLLLLDYSIHVSTESILELSMLLILKVIFGIATYAAVHYLLWRRNGMPVGFETRILELGNVALSKFKNLRSKEESSEG